MHPLLVLSHADSALTPFNAFAPGQGALGKPVWGLGQLLRDLELRVGLSVGAEVASDAARVLRFRARLQAKAAAGRFYSASFAVDPLGTTQSVLALRDALKTCGWDGSPIANGGARLDALAELESLTDPPLPPSAADRALTVASALARTSKPVYASLTLAEPEAAWPECWRRVFGALQATGTQMCVLAPLEPQASPATDLGRIQRALYESSSNAAPVELVGDGTFVRITAETSTEAAQGAAALLATLAEANTVVIREQHAAVLDLALGKHGLPSQGLHSSSPWRAALQVLPLTLELAFEPKDPQRILELLNLPQGPFVGAVCRYFTRALQRSPGVGGRAWLEAKAKLTTRASEPTTDDRTRGQLSQQLALVETWLESRGSDAIRGASKGTLLSVVSRVRAWLVEQANRRPNDALMHAGVQQCDDLIDALRLESRDTIDLVHARRLAEFVMNSGAALELTAEQVGRMAGVGSARALYSPARTVVWWMFTHAYEHAQSSPWRAQERTALAAANLERPNLELQLYSRAAAFRRAVFGATDRLILVAPRTAAGQTCASHPLWDELVAKVPLNATAQAAATRSCDALLRPDGVRRPNVPLTSVSPLALPTARTQWNVRLPDPVTPVTHSASSLSSLLGCPLQWALTYVAGLKTEEQSLTSQHLLAGSLGHRLIETLHEAGVFGADATAFRARAREAFDLLVEREGATLLRPGKAHELSQLTRQIVDAVCTLRDLLTERRLIIRSVEASFEVAWRDAQLKGRWDILVESADGQPLLIDVKWGHTKYRTMLKEGRALQLATYGQALRSQATPDGAPEPENAPITAAFYSLSTGRLLGVAPNLEGVELVPGDNLSNTWRRANRTLPLIEQAVAKGQLYVTGVSRAQPLLAELGVAESDRGLHYATHPNNACECCRYDGLCGRRWEALP